MRQIGCQLFVCERKGSARKAKNVFIGRKMGDGEPMPLVLLGMHNDLSKLDFALKTCSRRNSNVGG